MFYVRKAPVDSSAPIGAAGLQVRVYKSTSSNDCKLGCESEEETSPWVMRVSLGINPLSAGDEILICDI